MACCCARNCGGICCMLYGTGMRAGGGGSVTISHKPHRLFIKQTHVLRHHHLRLWHHWVSYKKDQVILTENGCEIGTPPPYPYGSCGCIYRQWSQMHAKQHMNETHHIWHGIERLLDRLDRLRVEGLRSKCRSWRGQDRLESEPRRTELSRTWVKL